MQVRFLHSGDFSQDIESVFRMMYTQIGLGNTGAEEICHHLLQTLLVMLIKQIDRSIDTEENKGVILGERIKKIY
ncbi:hypothetical protein GCM10020331_004070 [Ectobacillus funiculus]